MDIKTPAFQFYPAKWLTDTRRLSQKAKGFYIDLLAQIWLQSSDQVSIPNDYNYIASEVGITPQLCKEYMLEIMNKHRPLLLEKTSRLFSPGLMKEKEKQLLRRDRLRANGMLGGRPKKAKGLQKGVTKTNSDTKKKRLLSLSLSLPSGIKKNTKKKTTPYPEDFKVTDDIKKWAKEKGYRSPDTLLEHFKDHHTARGNKFIDWKAAFRTWIRNDAKFNPPEKDEDDTDPLAGENQL